MDAFNAWFAQFLIAIDQLFHVIFSGPHYLLFGGELPKANETISSRVGRAAEKGEKWALLCERFINKLFAYVGEDNHCRSSIKCCKCNEDSN